MPAARRAFGYSVRARSFTNDALGNLSAPGTATEVRGYTSTKYLDWHTAPRNARTPTGGDRLSKSDPAFLGPVCQSSYQVLKYPRTAVAVPGAGPSRRLRSGQALRSGRQRGARRPPQRVRTTTS